MMESEGKKKFRKSYGSDIRNISLILSISERTEYSYVYV
jgi:hypothetical protein